MRELEHSRPADIGGGRASRIIGAELEERGSSCLRIRRRW